VLTNLLGNALKFTSKGEVTLSARLENGRVKWQVEDTGPGIDVQDRQRVFESFEQVDGSISRRFGGTGLGLSISRQLVGLMDGTLELDSEPGRGSRFFFSVPLSPAPQGAKEPSPSPGTPRRARVVLAHPRSRENVVRWLTAAGFEVQLGLAGEALGSPDLLVMDDALRADLDRASAAGIPTLRCEQALTLEASPGPDQGGVARVALPLRRSEVLASVERLLNLSASAQPVRVLAACGHVRLLVVDDDAVNRTITSALLRRLGCEPLVLTGGRAALEALETQHFDLVLMDCEMPDLDGLAVTREVRRLEKGRAGPRVPIVALTAHATEHQRRLCLEADMDEMITKPVSLEALEQCVLHWAPGAEVEGGSTDPDQVASRPPEPLEAGRGRLSRGPG
jgi:CheY-like chemotaxis protein